MLWSFNKYEFLQFSTTDEIQQKIRQPSSIFSFIKNKDFLNLFKEVYSRDSTLINYDILSYEFIDIETITDTDFKKKLGEKLQFIFFYNQKLYLPPYEEINNDFINIDSSVTFSEEDEFIYSLINLFLKYSLEINIYDKNILNYLYNQQIACPNGMKYFKSNNMFTTNGYISKYDDSGTLLMLYSFDSKLFEFNDFIMTPSLDTCDFLASENGTISRDVFFVLFSHHYRPEDKFYIFNDMVLIDQLNLKVRSILYS